MSRPLQYLRSEGFTLGLVLATAFLLSSGSWKRNRWLSWLLNPGGSIDNIYQLIPILQQNARALFLVFNDLASAINSVAASHDGDSRLAKEDARALLSQEWVQQKLREVQDVVLEEFNVDAHALNEAISRFRNDDQVRMYTNGVELMYNIVLDGGYPQCPGVEICEDVTKEVALSILERVIEAKRDFLQHGSDTETTLDTVEMEVVYEEMQEFGYTSVLDAFIAFKNTENCYQYDFDFIKARQQLYLDPGQGLSTDVLDLDVQRLNSEELHIILETMEDDASLLLMLFESNSVDPEFVSSAKRLAESDPKAVLAWMLRDDTLTEYNCTSYPAVLRFRAGTLEEIIYHEPHPSVAG